MTEEISTILMKIIHAKAVTQTVSLVLIKMLPAALLVMITNIFQKEFA